MPDIYVRWYDEYGGPNNSLVCFVDYIRGRFLVVDENKNFRWVSTSNCEFLKETKPWA